MKNKLWLLGLIPFLSSCVFIPEYDGPKVTISKSSKPGLVETAPEDIYNYFVENNENGLLFLSNDHCEVCQESKIQIDAYSRNNQFQIMEANLTNISEDDYNLIKDCTTNLDNLYALPEYGEDLYLPTLYLFMSTEKGVGVANTTNSNFIDFLRMYIEII